MVLRSSHWVYFISLVQHQISIGTVVSVNNNTIKKTKLNFGIFFVWYYLNFLFCIISQYFHKDNKNNYSH